MKIYLDDERTPKSDGWNIVRDGKSFIELLLKTNLDDIELISFDHDLSDVNEMTGYDVINYLLDAEINWIIPYNVHSANPVGALNIKTIIDNWNKRIQTL